ncbi:YggT family protein [Uruburuella testudinis]|uniref:YggT family protein n=1 Tax=Uruburuella testudinis TaxID=1282863 RepID=A0ABY4DRQ3_9NEIS|nr:YggT family protein [Uruburuella testudinis]UOO81709.1 YggT family protein [Uruburuella testudinis]
MLAKVILLLADVLAIVCLTRCLLQWAKLPFEHPLAQFCSQTTDWLVKPLRKVAPPLGRWDAACVLACVVLYYLSFTLVLLLALPSGLGIKAMAANLLFTLLSLFKAVAYVLLLGLVLRMVLSFSNPYSPLLAVLHRIFEPLSRPFVFLKIGRYDFSGSVLVLVLWFWLSVILPQLTSKLNLWLLG